MKKIGILSVTVISIPSVLAYIDPGTGAVLLNTIWPFIVAFFSAILAFFIKWFWNPIKKFFSSIKKLFARS